MAKVIFKEISASERLRGSWNFFETFLSVTRVTIKIKIKLKKYLKFKTKIYQKLDALA